MSLIKNTFDFLGKTDETKEISNAQDKKPTGLSAAFSLHQESTNRLWEVFIEALKTPVNKIAAA